MGNNNLLSSIDYRQKIKDDVKQRGIKSLVHFTSINNLPSIIKKGLVSIHELKEQEATYYFNDTERLEGHDNSISLSISFPNYLMFSKYRLYGDLPKDMAVILLDPAILWQKDCAFYYNNAANRVFNCVPSLIYKDFNSWKSMFSDEVDNRLRSDLGIPINYTTSPQAEALCFETIEPKYIQQVLLENQSMYDKYYQILPKKEDFYFLHDFVFRPRMDYQNWR